MCRVVYYSQKMQKELLTTIMLLQKIKHRKNFLNTYFLKFLSSQVKNVQLDSNFDKKIPKRESKKKIAYPEIVNYLNECNLGHLIDKIPKELLRRSKGSRLYLMNPKVAESFATMVSEDLLQNASHVIETNPGLGFLTKELIEIGVSSINLYEKNKFFTSPKSSLGELLKSHQSQLKIKILDFDCLWDSLLVDKYNNDKISEVYLADIPYSGWRSKTFAQIITYFSSRYSLCLLIHNFFHFTDIFEHGRPSFLVAVPSLIWEVCLKI